MRGEVERDGRKHAPSCGEVLPSRSGGLQYQKVDAEASHKHTGEHSGLCSYRKLRYMATVRQCSLWHILGCVVHKTRLSVPVHRIGDSRVQTCSMHHCNSLSKSITFRRGESPQRSLPCCFHGTEVKVCKGSRPLLPCSRYLYRVVEMRTTTSRATMYIDSVT